MSSNLGHYTLDQLVDLITREVLAAYPPTAGQPCAVCNTDSCNGQCVQTNPDGARQVFDAGADRLTTRLGVKNVAADIASKIDHTLLKPQGTEEQIRQLCAEAREFQFATVCVNPTWVPLCAQLLAGNPVRVCAVIGFPLGATLPEVKAFESQRCVALGAHGVQFGQGERLASTGGAPRCDLCKRGGGVSADGGDFSVSHLGECLLRFVPAVAGTDPNSSIQFRPVLIAAVFRFPHIDGFLADAALRGVAGVSHF